MNRRRTTEGDLRLMREQFRKKSAKDPAGQPYCNCAADLPTPCGAYPMGRARGRTGRCEACAMGLHPGHSLERVLA